MSNQDLAIKAIMDANEGFTEGDVSRMVIALDDSGWLMPKLPDPKYPGFWEVDGMEINLVDKDGEVNLDWREGDYYRGEDRSLWLNRQQVLAIIAATNLTEEQK